MADKATDRDRMRAWRGTEPRPCFGCGKDFEREHLQVKVCSEECRIRAHKETYRRYMGRKPHDCIECGKPIEGDDYRRRQCSEQCKTTRQRRQKRFKRAAGRAAALDQVGEPFSEEELEAWLDTVGRQCAYCEGPFEHIDHITPMSRGGLHELANLNPSCAACNASKGSMLLSEWAGPPHLR